MSFSDVLVDLVILAIKEAFRVKQNPLSQVQYISDNEEEDDGYIPLLPLGKMALREEDLEEDIDICSSPLRLITMIDSFDVRN
jgi:hypothetical protein